MIRILFNLTYQELFAVVKKKVVRGCTKRTDTVWDSDAHGAVHDFTLHKTNV